MAVFIYPNAVVIWTHSSKTHSQLDWFQLRHMRETESKKKYHQPPKQTDIEAEL